LSASWIIIVEFSLVCSFAISLLTSSSSFVFSVPTNRIWLAV